MHVFCIFVFALVQSNLACFTWKGTLAIRLSLLLLLSSSSLFLCHCHILKVHILFLVLIENNQEWCVLCAGNISRAEPPWNQAHHPAAGGEREGEREVVACAQ